ncbi:MAG: NUDIX hydrolase [Ktedonobacterales bacterium]|nr:NUDIX hydrolase [Ktedonobacterales bacterium]
MLESQTEPAELAAGADVARPAVTVDVVMLTLVDGDLHILLVPRQQPPFVGQWALAGSFIRADESLETAAQRQLRQHLHEPHRIYLEQLYTFGAPERDPRTRVITVVYFALVGEASAHQATAGGRWFSVNQLPLPLAFDHEGIIHYTVARLRGKLDYTTIAFRLLPPEFSLSELQLVHEAILNRKLDKRNFRKKILTSDIFDLHETDRTKMEGPHRPARLYRMSEKFAN